METYDVTLEVDGVLHVSIEAESEEDAVRKARRMVLFGAPDGTLDFECVKVTLQVES